MMSKTLFVMSQGLGQQFAEAEQLLEEVVSWSEEEVEALPLFYKRKAREYRRLTNQGQE